MVVLTDNSQRRKTGLTTLMWIVSAIHAAVNFGQSEMTPSLSLVEFLSDEAKFGQELSLKWIDDQRIHQSFDKFAAELEVEKKIRKRNRDPKLKNRQGPVNIEYELLYPGT
ncbi:linoleate 9S-lipoxygenase 6-like [Olea europaea subsp. europaea]|uniref:Linoleate 9S-lipoxygenase 6-like n=1 Tax=Olea europaea subsp. europaea TaxID=158383 RepID=A0A8S0PPV2_OLEEU|nr:linoleate 9S-lipoxygenase 6-like [Olea europaea subsp. europaea]